MKYKDIIDKKYLSLTNNMKNIIKDNEYYTEEQPNKENDDHILNVFLKSNNKKILSVNYEILGFYSDKCNIFYWGTNILPSNKYIYKLSKKIMRSKKKLKEYIINKKYSDISFLEKLLYYTTNKIFYIIYDNIDDLLKYSCYITNSIGILTNNSLKDKKAFNIYYIIKNIKEIK